MNQAPPFSRLFLALWPEEKIRRQIAELSRSLQTEGGKPMRPRNYHVTLVFIGNVSPSEEFSIKQSISGIHVEPFVLRFNRISFWAKPKILCLTSRQPAEPAIRLAETLNTAVSDCGIETDFKPYQPHITIARKVSRFIERDCDPIDWRTHSFCLVKSYNGTYQIIGKFEG